MRFCKTCNAYIAEPFPKCPLCQNELSGEDDLIIFPVTENKKKKSLLFRIVTYTSILAIVISLCLDYILELNSALHWSIIVAIWCVYLIIAVAPLFVRIRSIGETIWNLGALGIIGGVLTMWFLVKFDLLFDLILPIVLIVILAAEFIIVILEKYTGSMSYFLSTAFGTMLLVLIRTIAGYEQAVLLNVALSVAIVLTILLFAIKNERMIGDIKRKFSL